MWHDWSHNGLLNALCVVLLGAGKVSHKWAHIGVIYYCLQLALLKFEKLHSVDLRFSGQVIRFKNTSLQSKVAPTALWVKVCRHITEFHHKKFRSIWSHHQDGSLIKHTRQFGTIKALVCLHLVSADMWYRIQTSLYFAQFRSYLQST